MKYILHSLWLLSILFFAACSEDNDPDLEAPVIAVEIPENEQRFEAGNNIPFNALYTDNEALSSTNIEIHNAFDDHGHGRKADDPSLSKFAYKETFEMPPDKSYLMDLTNEITIPENAMAGPYHFIVQALDAAGNATSFQDGSNIELTIFLTNNSMAQITIENLENGELEIEIDEPLIVMGTITDPEHPTLHGFEEILITLGEDHEDEHDHGRIMEDHLFEIEIHDDEISEYENPDGSLDIESMIGYTLNASTAAELIAEELDHLTLEISVLDKQGNIAIEIIPVHLHLE